jgi:hypothetical protein
MTRTDTEAFRRWFGNSVVRNADGSPRVVFHGTTAGGFTAFRPYHRKNEQLGFGIHFAESRDFARRYAEDPTVARKSKGAPQVYEAYLSVQRPLFADRIAVEGSPEFALAKKLAGTRLLTQTDEHGRKITYVQGAIDRTGAERAEKLIRDAGYDGVSYLARLAQPSGYGWLSTGEDPSWVVFSPTQIKSVNNRGTFDPSDPDILHGMRSVWPPWSV